MYNTEYMDHANRVFSKKLGNSCFTENVTLQSNQSKYNYLLVNIFFAEFMLLLISDTHKKSFHILLFSALPDCIDIA